MIALQFALRIPTIFIPHVTLATIRFFQVIVVLLAGWRWVSHRRDSYSGTHQNVLAMVTKPKRQLCLCFEDKNNQAHQFHWQPHQILRSSGISMQKWRGRPQVCKVERRGGIKMKYLDLKMIPLQLCHTWWKTGVGIPKRSSPPTAALKLFATICCSWKKYDRLS